MVKPALLPAPPELRKDLRPIAAEHGVAVIPTGGGSKLEIGTAPSSQFILLQTNRLNAVEFFDPGDLTVGVGAGMRLANLQSKIAEHQLFLPIDSPRARESSVGGALANAVANALGVEPRRLPLSPPALWELIQRAPAEPTHSLRTAI